MTQKQVVLFLGEVHGTITLQQQEITGHRWVSAAELPKYLHWDTYEAIKNKI